MLVGWVTLGAMTLRPLVDRAAHQILEIHRHRFLLTADD
jgi:hypothetical protein